jgi:hypothetical protein
MFSKKVRSGLKVMSDDVLAHEKWVEIPGYGKRFQVSNTGKVCIVGLNFEKKQLPVRFDKSERGGYLTVRLQIGGKSYTKYIHRLVAEAYIPNHMNKLEVKHRNGNKQDNRLKNLAWVTHAENIELAHNLRLIPSTSKPKVIEKIGKEIGLRF